MTTRRIVLHKALWNFDNFTSSSHKLLPFTPLPISSHPCHLFRGFQATRSSQWCCYSTEIRLNIFDFLFFGLPELSSNNLQLSFLRCRLSRRIWANIRARRSWTNDGSNGLKILIHWSTTQQIWRMCPFLAKLDLLIGLLKINILKRWHGHQGNPNAKFKWLEMCLEGHMWISFLSSSHSADLQSSQVCITLQAPCSLQTCDHLHMNEVHLNQNPKISDFKIDSGLDASVASPPMTLLDHNVDEFPRAYWTYSPRDLKKISQLRQNGDELRTMPWQQNRGSSVSAAFTKHGTEVDIIWYWYYEQISSVKQTNHAVTYAVVGHHFLRTRQDNIKNVKKHSKKSASQQKTVMKLPCPKKNIKIGAVFTVPRLKRETRFWTRRQWRPKNRTTKVSGLSLMWS